MTTDADRMDRFEDRLEKGLTRFDVRLDRTESRLFAKLDALTDDIRGLQESTASGVVKSPTAAQITRATAIPAGAGALAAAALATLLNWLQMPREVHVPAAPPPAPPPIHAEAPNAR